MTWPLDKEKHLQLNKRNKEIVNKRFYASAVSRAKVLNYLLNAKQRTVLLACQRRMPGRRKRSNTQPTEAPPKRGRNTQSTRRVATEVSVPIQDTHELPQNLLTKDNIPMIVKAVVDSLPSQATTRTNSTGLGTETSAERAGSSQSTTENRAQHHELGKLRIYPDMFVRIMYITEKLPSC